MSSFKKMLRNLFGSRKFPQPSDQQQAQKLHRQLKDNIAYLTQVFANSSDFALRELDSGAAVVFIKGIIDVDMLQEAVIAPLIKGMNGKADHAELELPTIESRTTCELNEVVSFLLRGHVAVLLDGRQQAALFPLHKFEKRSVEEPQAEKTIAGPREGFVESLATNLSLLRRRLRSPKFKSRVMHIGILSPTDVAICYLEGQVDDSLLAEVMQRLSNKPDDDLATVLDSSYLQEMISDHPLSLFPQMISTERPDRVIGNLLEGRVALLVDGSPHVLIAPAALPDFFQTPEEYYLRPWAAMAARTVRYVATVIATNITAIYVAVLTFHYEIIPARLIVGLAQSRAVVPFPVIVEALLLESAVELLREATNRLPTAVGQVIGVVGALVLGQAAVDADLISPLLVVVVATSTISSFAIPSNPSATAFRLLRFPLILAAGFL